MEETVVKNHVNIVSKRWRRKFSINKMFISLTSIYSKSFSFLSFKNRKCKRETLTRNGSEMDSQEPSRHHFKTF